MTNTPYIPPKIWVNESKSDNQWANINRPESGARFDRDLPTGAHPFQLYSLGTPNGQKVTIMFEELLALGVKEAEYDAFLIKIGESDQFSSGFVNINPNSKIPALVDTSNNYINIFESASILVYLAEKFRHFLDKSGNTRTQTFNWLFWSQGAAPFLGGGFGHFFSYADEKLEYPINRFAMEAKRQLDLLDKHLEKNKYINGDSYSIADMAIWPWYGNLILGRLYDGSSEFLQVKNYTNLVKWAQMIERRPAVQRGRIVNRTFGNEWEQLPERHSSADIDKVLALKT